MVLRTELNETVFYETVSVTVNQASGWHQWNWTSVEPLECTSLSVRIRSRDGPATSDWSNTQILQGNDLPSNEKSQMYPQDRIRPVGANTTFCCVVGEGKLFGNIKYSNAAMNETRLSRRSYAVTAVNQGLSGTTGTNVICYGDSKMLLTGTVVFVGYPPLPRDLVCETRDFHLSRVPVDRSTRHKPVPQTGNALLAEQQELYSEQREGEAERVQCGPVGGQLDAGGRESSRPPRAH